MKLTTQRRIAASILGCGIQRVHLDPARLNDIKEAITKSDMRLLVSDGVVRATPVKGVSRVRARKVREQKRKGLRRGAGSKKGRLHASLPSKEVWMTVIRAQRDFLRLLRERKLVSNESYRILYRRAKGGSFRSVRHMKLFIEDRRLWIKGQSATATAAAPDGQAAPRKERAAAPATAPATPKAAVPKVPRKKKDDEKKADEGRKSDDA